ncbi:hypothetical protein [Paraburkholderia sp. Cpub6]|uniref:hypothetical protein n=1 Tax=Paraburkholderia sp. Cpub6 TaxID=2723094 RepID=UPI001612D030|nr:hypothetical protein [Paraburkholderia sp. Cpub6]MBB5461586.1 hypothetical protein [Paraburkholderia sp. Cpub6]
MNVILSRTADNIAALRFRLASVVLRTTPPDAVWVGKKACKAGKNSNPVKSPTASRAPAEGRYARCDADSAKRANAVAVSHATSGPGGERARDAETAA